MKKVIEVKECYDCKFSRDYQDDDYCYCNFYEKSIPGDKPDWCKVKKITVEEEG